MFVFLNPVEPSAFALRTGFMNGLSPTLLAKKTNRDSGCQINNWCFDTRDTKSSFLSVVRSDVVDAAIQPETGFRART